jgi:hypothetical protein
MTDEELAKEFRHIHDRFDYLMGQVESISKTDLLESLHETASVVNRTIRRFSKIEARLDGIDQAVSALAWDRNQRRAASARRKAAEAPSVWEMLHQGSA